MKLREIVAATMAALALQGAPAAPEKQAAEPARDNGAEMATRAAQQEQKPAEAKAEAKPAAPEAVAPQRLSAQSMQDILDAKREMRFFENIDEPTPDDVAKNYTRTLIKDGISEKKFDAIYEAAMANPDDLAARSAMKELFDIRKLNFTKQMDAKIEREMPALSREEKALFYMENQSGFVSSTTFKLPEETKDGPSISASKFAAGVDAPQGPGSSPLAMKEPSASAPSGPPPVPGRSKPSTPGMG